MYTRMVMRLVRNQSGVAADTREVGMISSGTSTRLVLGLVSRRLLLAACLASGVNSLQALDPRLSITQYLHTSWTQEEGIDLPPINAIAQTTDGYLWLGTRAGLIRFDGMRFVRWEAPPGDKPPDDEIRDLLATDDGDLWIRTGVALARLHRGHIVRYPEVDLWLKGKNRAMASDRDGTLWVVRLSDPSEVASLRRDGTFRVFRMSDGLPDRAVQNIFADRNSQLWIATDSQICRWKPGASADCATAPRVGMLTVEGGAAANLLLEGDREPVVAAMMASPPPKCAFRDHNGNIWMGTAGQGLVRLTPGEPDRFTRMMGLSHDYVRAILEDREHNLFVATARGLDRFRDPPISRISKADGLSNDLVTAVHGSRDGAVWVGTYGNGLNRVSGNRATAYPLNPALVSGYVLSLFEDDSRRLWVGTSTGCGYVANGRFVPVRLANGSPLPGVFTVSTSPDGSTWLANSRLGLMTVQKGVAVPVSMAGLRTQGVLQLQLDHSKRLWIGYLDGAVSVIDGMQVRNYFASDGLARTAIQNIAEDRAGTIWVGGQGSLSRYRNQVWTTWTRQDGVPSGGVWGISDDGQDGLWLMTSEGLSRLSVEALRNSPDGAPKKLEFALYGQGDGVRLASTSGMANPRSSRSLDGRLWISTDDGVAIVDSSLMRRNPQPPPVAVEELVVDGKPVDVNSIKELRFRGRHVHITYTGLSLMAPERVRFRYRLEGLDQEWTDAGARRSVEFVNLSPAHYRFHVTARNNNGVWGDTGASLSFQIEPNFYQTRWFAGACILAVALIVWGIHRLRVRMLMTRHEATAQERIRLTRELHDSLLQGFVGVVYQLEAAARQFETAPEQGKNRLERAIGQADRALAEARQTMLAMRLPALEKSSLPEALHATAGGLTEGTTIGFHLDVRGRVRQLPYDAQANIFLIGREAITNSVNHARPTTIQAGLTYTAKQVRLTVQDDGSGFDLETAKAKHDHWGMAGMQERANQIGATFSVCSSPGQGTKVEVVVPCKQ